MDIHHHYLVPEPSPAQRCSSSRFCLKCSVCSWFQTRTSLTSWSPVSGYTLPHPSELVGSDLTLSTSKEGLLSLVNPSCCIHLFVVCLPPPKPQDLAAATPADERVGDSRHGNGTFPSAGHCFSDTTPKSDKTNNSLLLQLVLSERVHKK